MGWPGGSDLTAFLAAQGIPAPTDPSGSVEAAVAEWEAATGWRPFLAEATARAWRFDPPEGNGRTLDLRGGFAQVSEVRIDARTIADGVALLDDQWSLLPWDAPSLGRPATAVRLETWAGSRPGSVVVVGRRGWGDEIPADAARAVLARAVALCLPETTEGASGGVSQMEIGDRKVKYDVEAGRGKADRWTVEFEACAARYRRTVL